MAVKTRTGRGFRRLMTDEDKAKITEYNSGTLLLRLPQELKDMIWKLVLGGGNIELVMSTGALYSNKWRLQYHKVDEYIATSGKTQSYIAHMDDGHVASVEDTTSKPLTKYMQAPRPYDYNLLLTCQSILDVARYTPYTANQFYFTLVNSGRSATQALMEKLESKAQVLKHIKSIVIVAHDDLLGKTEPVCHILEKWCWNLQTLELRVEDTQFRLLNALEDDDEEYENIQTKFVQRTLQLSKTANRSFSPVLTRGDLFDYPEVIRTMLLDWVDRVRSSLSKG